MKKRFLVCAVLCIAAMNISGCDMNSYQSYVPARVDEQQRPSEDSNGGAAVEEKQEENIRICDNNAFNAFAVEWNENHPDEIITSEMVEEQSDLVGMFKFESIEVRMLYHESSPASEYEGYVYCVRDLKGVSLDEFCNNAIPYMRDVFKLSDENIECIIDSFKTGNKSYYIDSMEYEYREKDTGNVQSITQYRR